MRHSMIAAVSIAGVLAMAACGGSTPGPTGATATPSPGAVAPRHLLVVTYTAGFRHSSIPIAESTLRELGTASGLYDTTYCRTDADVRAMLTPDALRRF